MMGPKKRPVANARDTAYQDCLPLERYQRFVAASPITAQVTSDHPDQFFCSVAQSRALGTTALRIDAGGHTVERTAEFVRRDHAPFYKASVHLHGNGILIQDGRETLLRPGDLAIYDTGRPYSLMFDGPVDSAVLAIPHRTIDLPQAAVTQLTAVRLPRDDALVSMITPLISGLTVKATNMSQPISARVTRSAVDLLSALFAQQLGVDQEADPRAVLFARVRAYVEDNLSDPGLGPESIAAAHYVSTRHLHAVFHEQSTTVASWIRTRRLDRCGRDLLDPAVARQSVATVGSRWGFADPAHFSRVFKAEFGVSPNQWRKANRWRPTPQEQPVAG